MVISDSESMSRVCVAIPAEILNDAHLLHVINEMHSTVIQWITWRQHRAAQEALVANRHIATAKTEWRFQ